MYAKWVQSWRDLPILINQWANVVRWEKVTRPFLRTTEFLWQEGHTAHETARRGRGRDADDPRSLRETCRNRAGDAGRQGQKSESEKFAGALRTYSIEALMGDGRALQAGTSHNLGQNFAKAFDITFQARDKSVQHVWGTSWGVSTRLVGGVDHDARRRQRPGAAAAHRAVSGGDRADRPRQLARDGAAARAGDPSASSSAAGIRVTLDDRDERPGWKFAEWELRGVPLRLEIGPKDIEKSAGAGRAPRYAREAERADGRPGRPRRAAARRDPAQPARARAARSATSTPSASPPTTSSSR